MNLTEDGVLFSNLFFLNESLQISSVLLWSNSFNSRLLPKIEQNLDLPSTCFNMMGEGRKEKKQVG